MTKSKWAKQISAKVGATHASKHPRFIDLVIGQPLRLSASAGTVLTPAVRMAHPIRKSKLATELA